MTWVRQKPVKPLDEHQCKPPSKAVVFGVPGTFSSGDGRPVRTEQAPNGEFGDLWRCDRCHTLWRIGNACDACDPRPPQRSGEGRHPGLLHGAVWTAWRRATWWQRLVYNGR